MSDMVTVDPEWMHNYKPGYMGFTWRRGRVTSIGVGYFTRWERMSDIAVDHVFIVADFDTVVQATFPQGVHAAPLHPFLENPRTHVFFRKPKGYTVEIGDSILAEADTHLGEHYDLSLIGAHALAGTFLGRLIKIRTGLSTILNSPGEWICSELGAHAMDSLPEYHNRGVLALPDCAITPQAFFEDGEIWEDWKRG